MRKRKSNENMSKEQIIATIITLIVFVLLNYTGNIIYKKDENTEKIAENINTNVIYSNYNLANVPEYTNKIYIEINNNEPYFDKNDYTTEAFEKYSNLDDKERCGIAYANICKKIMPKAGQTRESISMIKPSGWKQTKINGEYLYNRCHLIAYQLADESANEKNLITGTRYFNTEGMLPFENEVANYMKQNPNNHVLYRVTPDFKGDNLVASGVEIEAYSVEDNGEKVKFNVYIYNVQPGVTIDYLTGKITQN